MQFNIDGTGVHFTDRDFAIVTDLKCSGKIDDNNNDINNIKTYTMHYTYLDERASLDKEDLKQALEDAKLKYRYRH